MLLCLWACTQALQAQAYLYKETHTEQCYTFVLADTLAYSHLNDLERIRFEGHFKQCRYTHGVLANKQEWREVLVDSDDHRESWMQLANRFVYNANGTTAYNSKNEIVYMKAADSAAQNSYALQQRQTDSMGIHPGIPWFPAYTAAAIAALKQQGILITETKDGVCIQKNQDYFTIDSYAKRVLHEYRTEEGIAVKEICIYQALKDQQGYVPAVRRTERNAVTQAGHCITQVELRLYSDYTIDDPGGYIQKAMQAAGQIQIYPNPGNGVFQVKAETGSDALSWIRVVNVNTGVVYQPDLPQNAAFELNLTMLPAGQYTLQVGTAGAKVLSCNFIKQ